MWFWVENLLHLRIILGVNNRLNSVSLDFRGHFQHSLLSHGSMKSNELLKSNYMDNFLLGSKLLSNFMHPWLSNKAMKVANFPFVIFKIHLTPKLSPKMQMCIDDFRLRITCSFTCASMDLNSRDTLYIGIIIIIIIIISWNLTRWWLNYAH